MKLLLYWIVRPILWHSTMRHRFRSSKNARSLRHGKKSPQSSDKRALKKRNAIIIISPDKRREQISALGLTARSAHTFYKILYFSIISFSTSSRGLPYLRYDISLSFSNFSASPLGGNGTKILNGLTGLPFTKSFR